jgi:hypothetical protein
MGMNIRVWCWHNGPLVATCACARMQSIRILSVAVPAMDCPRRVNKASRERDCIR